MRKSVSLAFLAIPVLLAACGGSTPCDGVKGACVALSASATESEISSAFVQAAPNTTIAFAAGTYSFKNSLNLASVKGVTIKGAGIGKTILDFSTVVGSGEGIVATSTDSLLFVDFTARDTKGNGIKVIGSDGVTWRRVQTIWTNPDGHTHGAYGLYPVQSHNILIENCEVAGAADAGVYVGQSDHIVVRNNDVHHNVAGIELENSSYGIVHDNNAHDNVGGILVFNMPDLQVNEGGFHRIYNNTVRTNNAVNFAARGSSVARVPGGTGAFVLAGHDIELDHNTFDGNKGAALSVISYPLTGDPRVAGCDGSALLSYGYCAKMWPARVFIHDNAFTGNGVNAAVDSPSDCPDPTHPGSATDCPDPVAWQLGRMLAASGMYVPQGSSYSVAPLVYDGMVDPTATSATWGGTAGNPQSICYGPAGSNGGAYFLNLQFDTSGGSDFSAMTTDMTAYQCSLTSQALADADVTAKAP
jgi:parallel beta-helix repeat protein